MLKDVDTLLKDPTWHFSLTEVGGSLQFSHEDLKI